MKDEFILFMWSHGKTSKDALAERELVSVEPYHRRHPEDCQSSLGSTLIQFLGARSGDCQIASLYGYLPRDSI